jgi:hypothetical protein
MPVVVNRHHYKAGLPHPHVYIGRGTPLGNEVSRKGEGLSDEEAIAVYEQWLREKVENRDPAVLGALNSITPAHSLVCSCAPAPCHGDPVVRVWEWLAGKGEW